MPLKVSSLGSAGAGLVKGVPKAEGVPTNRNAHYGVKAVELLRAGTHRTVTALWTEVTSGDELDHAAQMDVVLALWKNSLIVTA